MTLDLKICLLQNDTTKVCLMNLSMVFMNRQSSHDAQKRKRRKGFEIAIILLP